jgi:hypothetical protein
MENRVKKLEQQMRLVNKQTLELKKIIKAHLELSEVQQDNIHLAMKDINQTLVALKDPIITVKNGKEEQKLQSDVLKESWEALAPLRTLQTVQAYFHRHRVQKLFLIIGIVFSFVGVIWAIVSVPLTDLFDTVLKLIKHIL